MCVESDPRRVVGGSGGRVRAVTWCRLLRPAAVAAVLWSVAGCGERYASEGERLAHEYCSACHAFPEPALLDKETWQLGVLPEMAPRLGVRPASVIAVPRVDSALMVLPIRLPRAEWQKIVDYYASASPESLPDQVLPDLPRLDPEYFSTGAFAQELESTGIITLLEADTSRGRVYAGEAGTNRLWVFDRSGVLIASRTLGSPPTDVIPYDDHVLVLESGILHPNDEPRGRLARYDLVAGDSLSPGRVLIDSLFRPVYVEPIDADGAEAGFLVCEYGDNRGRFALYRVSASGFDRQVLDPSPGAIRFEIRDITGDGHRDIVALFAQGDERLVLFENDGRGGFDDEPRVLARFPAVYGSMHFSLHDFNGDGHLDILHANGDNFDYSRVRKPYHGIRILENDGRNRFEQRYFFPIYGAARAEAVDFDDDGDPDILATSNFADPERNPERSIMFFENIGAYAFEPHAFSVSAGNQWNLITIADLDGDGRRDALIGAMSLESIGYQQRGQSGRESADRNAILLFRNRMPRRSP